MNMIILESEVITFSLIISPYWHCSIVNQLFHHFSYWSLLTVNAYVWFSSRCENYQNIRSRVSQKLSSEFYQNLRSKVCSKIHHSFWFGDKNISSLRWHFHGLFESIRTIFRAINFIEVVYVSPALIFSQCKTEHKDEVEQTVVKNLDDWNRVLKPGILLRT